MKNFLKKNWYWVLIVAILCSIINVMRINKNANKKDTPQYKTVTTKKEAIKYASVPDTVVKKFTEIKTVTRYIDKIKIDTIKINYKDTVKCDFERYGQLKTKEYSFDYSSNNKGLKLSNFIIKDSLLIVTGTKKKWFLGKETNTIDISHSNKYIKSDSVIHIEVEKKKKFYETTLFKFGVGFVLGVAVTK